MRVIVLLFLSLAFFSCQTETTLDVQSNKSKEVKTETQTEGFDAQLAEEWGADEYGMRKYVIAYLKVGPNRENDPEKANQLQAAHMSNIKRLSNEGTLILAGPFLDDTDTRGIYIFDVETIEEAKKLTATDPMIKSGHLIMELHPWYGSAALKTINDLHKKGAKTIF